jgi:phytoene dehydrogenase-like protein
VLEPAYQADVVIVGAGVAGLSAAHRLTSAGVTTAVLEAAPWVGGRMSTEKVDGFRLDRIGQLLSTAYPDLRLSPGLDGLGLRPFAPGVLLHSDGRHHRAGAAAGTGGARGALHVVRALASTPRSSAAPKGRSLSRQTAGAGEWGDTEPSGGPRVRGVPRSGAGARGVPWPGAVTRIRGAARPVGTPGALRGAPRATAPLGTAVDQARLGPALSRIANAPVERLLARAELPAGQALAASGVPGRTIEGFLRPLLAALLCDPELTTSSRSARSAHTGVRVTSVSTTSVTTAEHGEIRCRAVLLATDARAAAGLLPGLRVPDFHPVTVVHHTTDEPPATGAALLLDSDRGGPVAHTSVISRVDPSRAPAGRALVTSTVLGTPPADLDTAVRTHLARLYGTSTRRWETLAVHHTREAVPAMRPPHDLRRPVRLLAGLYVCGDHRDTSTVQGALHSAHRAAAAILADLGASGSLHVADPPRTMPRAA